MQIELTTEQVNAFLTALADYSCGSDDPEDAPCVAGEVDGTSTTIAEFTETNGDADEVTPQGVHIWQGRQSAPGLARGDLYALAVTGGVASYFSGQGAS